MVTETVIDHERFSMWYYPDKKIIHHKFHSDFYGPELRAALEKGTEILRQYGARKWLSDDRGYGELPQEDVDWGLHDWGPKTVMAGWRYWAIVMPEAALGQVAHTTFERIFSSIGVTAKVFRSPDDAMSWLEKM